MDIFRLSGISFGSPRSDRFSANDAFSSNPKRPKNKIPASFRTWKVAVTISGMVVLALGIEIALYFSNRSSGFHTGDIETEKVQWFSGFIPTLLIGPFVWIWKLADKDFKKLQPYVLLSQGPVEAEASVLLDLEHGSLWKMLKSTLKNGYYIVLCSTVIVVLNILLHPLAGSFFLVKPSAITQPTDLVRSTSTFGLNPLYRDLTSFVAAAGFAQAAAFHNLSDPPFIWGSWAIATSKFTLDVSRNSSVTTSAIGVQTNVSCSAPRASLAPPTSAAPLNWTLTASLPSGCAATHSVDSTASSSQYGALPVQGCSSDTGGSNAPPFAPVLFWFFITPQGGTPLASVVFCTPSIAAYTVNATVDGATGLLAGVNVTGGVDAASNNVTGGTLAGKAFNGVSFDSDADFNLSDPFVRARALAVQSGLPGAVFRLASDPRGGMGMDTLFGSTTRFLELTEHIYTQYMSLVALANYFVPTDEPIAAELTLWPNRLWINPRSAHILTGVLLAVAVSGAAIHVVHRRQRRRLYLASRPGSLAHYMSILSHPQLAALISDKEDIDRKGGVRPLGPRDNDRTMRRKLKDVMFMLDESGCIVPVLPGASRAPNREREMRRESAASAYTARSDDRVSLLGAEYKIEPYQDPFDQRNAT